MRKTTPAFKSLAAAVTGEPVHKNGWLQPVWPEFDDGDVTFLKSCPLNKKGWHFFQIPGGPVIHYKTGVDFRNPSMPYHVVRVAGRQVLALVGHKNSDEIIFEEGPNRKWFSATTRGRTVYMPEGWQPDPEALKAYRRFCGGDARASYHNKPASDGERMVLWGASLPGLYGGQTEKQLRENIDHCRKYPGEYSNPEDAVAAYVNHMLPIHLRVKSFGYMW